MDTSRELYEVAATGATRGVYDDITRTFRAPVVNWIFRTLAANHPDFLRYAWGQVKPAFGTRGFARFSVAYRDGILSAVGDALPSYRPGTLTAEPAASRELRGQLATFDVVAPRLAAFFELLDRELNGDGVPTAPPDDRAATAPAPDWLDADRGLPVTMIPDPEPPDRLADTAASVRAFHGLGDGFPSVYRCLAQWPAAFERLWDDVEPALRSDGFAAARSAADDRAAAFADGVAYEPRLSPDDLAAVGVEREAVAGLAGLFERFNGEAIGSVLTALPAYATTVDAAGPRSAP